MSAYEHTMMVLEEMNKLRPNDEIALLMALSHDMGKSRTNPDDLPSHPIHGELGCDVVDDMQERLSLSNDQANAMKEASRYHMQLHDIDDLRESTVIDIVQNVDNIPRLIALAVADSRGREPSSEADATRIAERLGLAQAAVEAWTGQRLIDEGYDPDDMGGKEFGDLLRQKRVEWMRKAE